MKKLLIIASMNFINVSLKASDPIVIPTIRVTSGDNSVAGSPRSAFQSPGTSPRNRPGPLPGKIKPAANSFNITAPISIGFDPTNETPPTPISRTPSPTKSANSPRTPTANLIASTNSDTAPVSPQSTSPIPTTESPSSTPESGASTSKRFYQVLGGLKVWTTRNGEIVEMHIPYRGYYS